MNPFHYKANPTLGDIEAVQFGAMIAAAESDDTTPIPQWFTTALADETIKIGHDLDVLHTLEGSMIIGEDSYILKLNDGSLTAIHSIAFRLMFSKSI